MKPRIGSLCTGYGGLDMAVEMTTGPCDRAWHAETDPDASRILDHHYPLVPNLGDITAVDWTAAEQVDILTAGFPCQPFSAAGSRSGAADDRHLWPVGVLPAITALRPPTVILENVPGLLTIDRGSVFRQVLGDLNALGYTTRWTTIGACAVGACHHRHRIFIHATLAAARPPEDAMFGLPLGSVRKWPMAGMVQDGEMWETAPTPCGTSGLTLPTPTVRDADRGAGWGDRPGCPLSEMIVMLPTPTASDHTGAGQGPSATGAINLRTAAALLPTPGARLGDDRGQPSADTATARMESGRRNLDDAIALLPTPRASDGAKGGPNQRGSSGDLALPAAVQPERWGRWAAAVARHEMATGTHAPDPTMIGIRGGRRLSPAFAEWMMALPPGWVTGVPVGRSAQIKALGNGVVPTHGAYALRMLGMGAELPVG